MSSEYQKIQTDDIAN